MSKHVAFILVHASGLLTSYYCANPSKNITPSLVHFLKIFVPKPRTKSLWTTPNPFCVHISLINFLFHIPLITIVLCFWLSVSIYPTIYSSIHTYIQLSIHPSIVYLFKHLPAHVSIHILDIFIIYVYASPFSPLSLYLSFLSQPLF